MRASGVWLASRPGFALQKTAVQRTNLLGLYHLVRLGPRLDRGLRTDSLLIGNTSLRASQLVAIGSVIVAAALMVIGLRNAKGKPLMVPLAVKDLKKQAEAGDRFTPDTLPAGAPHAEFVKATDAMNARLDALDLSEVEIEEIETPKE